MSDSITVYPAARSLSAPDETQRLASWSSDLIAMQAAVSNAQDFQAVMEIVAKTTLRLMRNADGAAVALAEGAYLHVHEGFGTMWRMRGLKLPLAHSLAGEVLASSEPCLVHDASCDPRIDPVHFKLIGARSIIMVPVPFMGRAVGTLTFHARMANAFDVTDLDIARLLTGPLAIGFSAARGAQAELALSNQSRRFAATFEQAAVGIAHVAPDGRYLLVNDRFCSIVGHSREALMDLAYQSITHADDIEADDAGVRDLLDGTCATFSIDKRYVRADGTLAWGNATVSLVRGRDGEPEFFVAVLQDISARKLAEDAANHDALTGLPNRRSLTAMLAEALAGHGPIRRPLAIAYMDLDGFKGVNDRLGHAEGDVCLKQVAKALDRATAQTGFAGRWGGDEFLAVIACASEAEARQAIAAARAAVSGTARQHGWDIDISAGVLFVPDAAAAGRMGALDAITWADRLMYQAKQGGEGAVVACAATGNRRAA